jgi:uncharacterized Zn finger protein
MTETSLQTIEKLTTSSNLERGKSYYYSGQVKEIKNYNGRFIEAIVEGTKTYRLVLKRHNKVDHLYCNCPYDSKGYCKHQVALKFALMETPEKMEQISLPQKKEQALYYIKRLLILFSKIRYKLF